MPSGCALYLVYHNISMESPSTYIPVDRRHALARGEQLPERSTGAVLFADISGFTPLTEALVRALGPERGTEELPRQLNLVYDALIAEVERYGGSVLGFAGDAITCWFAEQAGGQLGASGSSPAAWRAAACGLALQAAMAPFTSIVIPGAGTVSLAIKVAVASGPVRRFLVGDPTIQTIDALAGTTLARMAAGEHLAGRGEVIIDLATVEELGELALMGEWRTDAQHGRFAVLSGLREPVAPAPWPPLADDALPEQVSRPWLLPPVYERLRAGMGEFLTELRHAVALFLHFGGIDYDNDPLAQAKLDAFMLWTQRVLRQYDSYVLQLTIGDKGSFLYAAFGAPTAYEDDAVRACLAALELREPRFEFISDLQIGISQGRTRTGAYGASVRRTYGALGDEINVAARLMQSAPVGQAIATAAVRRSSGGRFAWESQPPLLVKGKTQPLSTFRLIGLETQRTIRLHEPRYRLPMVGRATELHFIVERLAMAAAGQGQIVAISAEAGLGKSRLIAEVVRQAQTQGIVVFGGECQSYGLNTPYLVWRDIWRRLFGLDPATSSDEQIAALKVALARLDPALLPRLPLLAPVLDLPIPDNELTRSFEPRLRKQSLEELLVRVLQQQASATPLLLVLEDCHWLDALSHELLEAIGRALGPLPVLLIMAYRPLQLQRLSAPRVAQLPFFRELPLDSLVPEEVEALIRLKLVGEAAEPEALPAELVALINTRAQGNPFYVEELLNYMRDRGLDPRTPGALAQLELPPSLHSLILSRIDRLSESQKSLIKVASVIGRLFRAALLWGLPSFSGERERVRHELAVLSELELTPLDTPEPELTYLFKHIVTQEVTYESLPYATRAVLHEQIGLLLERGANGQGVAVDLLAFHYDRSENLAKRQEYLRRAGVAAQAVYANRAALDYYRRVLPLLAETEQGDVLFKLGQVLELVGEWDEAAERYETARALAEAAGDAAAEGHARIARGELLRKRGRYGEASQDYEQARALFVALGDQSGLARVISCAGSLAFQQGDVGTARALFEECVNIRRRLGVPFDTARALSNLGIVSRAQGNYQLALELYNESMQIQRMLNNRWAIAATLTNIAYLARAQGDHQLCQTSCEEALAIQLEVGDSWAVANTLHALGTVLRDQGNYAGAAVHFASGLRTCTALDDRYTLAYLLEDGGVLLALVGQPERALRLVAAAGAQREAIGAPRSAGEQEKLDAGLAPARAALGSDEQAAAVAQGQAMDAAQASADALDGLG